MVADLRISVFDLDRCGPYWTPFYRPYGPAKDPLCAFVASGRWAGLTHQLAPIDASNPSRGWGWIPIDCLTCQIHARLQVIGALWSVWALHALPPVRPP